jgi:type III restriction enzyme
MTQQARPFLEQPILNFPHDGPTRHHPLDADGQPLNEPLRDGWRKSELIASVPKLRKRKGRNRL